MTISNHQQNYQPEKKTPQSLISSTRRLLKKCSKAVDKKVHVEEAKRLTEIWSNVNVGRLITEGASPNVLQGLIHHIDQLNDSELIPLRTQLFYVEKVVRNNMYGAVTAESHLENHLGADYSKHSFAAETESFYDSLGSEIDLKMLFNIFADEWGRGRTTHKKESLEGDHPFRFLNLYEKMCQFYRPIPGSVDRTQLEADYASAKALNSEIDKVQTPMELNTLCDGIEERLKSLKAGESVFIPGGWSGYPDQGQKGPKVPGHAMMYQISKVPNETYSIRIYNSGAGLKYHQLSGEPDRHNPAVEWFGLSEEIATDSVFWQQVLEAQVIPRVLQNEKKRPKTYGEGFIYQEFQKHLKKDCPHPRAAVELADLKDQRAGTCSRKGSPDMIGRARLPGKDFKRLRLEEKVLGFGLLFHLIKKGGLSPSDQKFAKELYIKTLPKIWVALSKYHNQYEPHSLESTAYLIATLKGLEKEEWKGDLTPEIELEKLDKPVPARISVEKLLEIKRNIRALTRQETPLLHMSTVGVGTETALENLSPIQKFMTSLDATVGRLSVGMEHADPLDLLSQLQSEVYEHLPPPTGEGIAFWKQTVDLKQPELEALFKNLQIVGWMSYQANHRLGQMLPGQILNAWKTYAAVTYVLRNRPELSDIVKATPVSWAHFNAVYDHPLFSQFTGKFAEEAKAIRDFFQQDSAGGASLAGEDLTEVLQVPLFDYSWKKVSVTERDKIPEVSCPENYIESRWAKHENRGYEQGKKGGTLFRCMSAWSQMAQFAEHAIWGEFNPKSANSSSHMLESYKPLSTEFDGSEAWIENKTNSGPAELNLQCSLWQPSKQTEPFLKRLWAKGSLEQSGVIRELNNQGKQSDELSYHMDMISSSPPSLKLHLLLSYFEEHPSKLLEKDNLDYFMAHLHAGRSLAETLEREPLFLDRLLKFFVRLAEEDSQKPHNDPSVQRMLQVLYTICKIHQAVPNHPASSVALEKIRDRLSKMPFTNPEVISQRARYMLASYSLAPPSRLSIDDYFQSIFENKQEEIKGGFEAFIALEASRFHLTVLPELLKAMQDEKNRSRLLSSILQPAEELLSSRSLVPVTVTQELLTLQTNLLLSGRNGIKIIKN